MTAGTGPNGQPVQLVERAGPGEPAAEAAAALADAGLGPVRALAPDPAAPVVYHATALDRYLPLHLAAETTGPIVVVAHGLATPPEPGGTLARLEPAWARDLAASAAALAVLAPRGRAVVVPGAPPDTTPVVARAAALGLPAPVVAGPVADPGAWRTADPNPATVHHVADTMRTTVVVCETALTPLVPVVALLEAFHAYATWRDRRARLVVTGPVPMAGYARVVQRWVEELALGAAWLAGVLAPGELRPVFERADAAVVLPGCPAARARAAAAAVPAIDFDGADPLGLADRLGPRTPAAPVPGAAVPGAPVPAVPVPLPTADPLGAARLIGDALA